MRFYIDHSIEGTIGRGCLWLTNHKHDTIDTLAKLLNHSHDFMLKQCLFTLQKVPDNIHIFILQRKIYILLQYPHMHRIYTHLTIWCPVPSPSACDSLNIVFKTLTGATQKHTPPTLYYSILWSEHNSRHFTDDIFQGILLNWFSFVCWLKFHGRFLQAQLTIRQHWLDNAYAPNRTAHYRHQMFTLFYDTLWHSQVTLGLVA